MKAYIVTYPFINNLNILRQKNEEDYIIAVDDAVFFLIGEKIKFDYAIGDFDSNNSLSYVKSLKNVIILPEEKDQTDTEAAIELAAKLKVKETVLLGGIGGERIEHTLANITLIKKYPNLRILNDQSEIFSLSEGNHTVKFDGYVNIFAEENSTISLEGFKYPLKDYHLKPEQVIGISNEITANFGQIAVKKGRILVILTILDNKKRQNTP
ncbi:MAG TPA: thiamine diphosphokinase [Acholeplasma sp.]|nr:thiamine diphosphokinase [Acholeplasma sp.]